MGAEELWAGVILVLAGAAGAGLLILLSELLGPYIEKINAMGGDEYEGEEEVEE